MQRSRIVNPPANVDAAAGFSDPAIKEAFLAYTTYVLKNYKPDYLALGVEINMLYERSPKQFDAFVEIYDEAYDAGKGHEPQDESVPDVPAGGSGGDVWRDTSAALGGDRRVPWTHGCARHQHVPVPARAYAAPRISGQDYYSQLKSHWDGEVLVSETGYASAPVDGQVNVGTEEDQQAYLARLLDEATKNSFSMVVWFAALDPAFADERAPSSSFKDIGLRHSDGSNKTRLGHVGRVGAAPAEVAGE